jgi:RNA polymerase sigma-70 factor (ECF subfamily)
LEQETYLRIVLGFAGFTGKCSFRTWVYLIVRNTYYSLLKANNRTSATSIEELTDRQQTASSENVFVNEAAVSEEVDAANLVRDFLAWLRKRNVKHARIIELNLEGYEDREIAALLGVAYRTVCSVLYRAPRDYQKFLAGTQKQKLKKAQQTAG